MVASILHRVTGFGMATVGGVWLIAWLVSLAGGPESYAAFLDLFTVESGAINIVGAVLGIGLSWAFFTHLFNGIRHFVMDTGAGFELQANKAGAMFVYIGGLVATVLLWVWLLWPTIFGGGA